METLKIEKVPLPTGASGNAKYLHPKWDKVKEGDSVFISEPGTSGPHYRSIKQTAFQYGFHIKTRKEGSGRRIWFIDRKIHGG